MAMAIGTRTAGWLLAALLAGFCGCGREGASLAELEARERSSRLFANAMDDLNAGRTDHAIAGFEQVVRREPNAYSAHFQLATLLQDVRKDFIGAIAHYRDYLAMRPASDKATVAQERLKLCETLLAAEYIRKAGGSVSDKLSRDNEKLMAEKAALAVQVKKLEVELASTRKQLDKLAAESEMRRRLLAKLDAGESASAPNRALSAKEALAELKALEAEEKRRRIRPTDAELLDEDDAPAVALGKSDEVRKLVADAEREAKADAGKPQAKRPPKDKLLAADGPSSGGLPGLFTGKPRQKKASAARPETYTVQDGDTLFGISTRFYGGNHMWRSIRDANRATIPADGRLRVGQEIRLP
ncbi:MAG: LysM peptidoglycan-binding domain-containing protein [Kiritimatiellia bacterium]